MNETARQIARVERAIPHVGVTVGTFLRMEGGLAVVNVGSETITIPCEGWYPPTAGMPVRLQSLNGAIRVTGPNRALPPRGEVTAVGGADVTVDVQGESFTLPYVANYSPMVSDIVIIDWAGHIVMGEQSAAPDVTEPPPNIPTTQPFTDLIVQASASGRYYGGTLRGDEVWASPSNDGGWFYSHRFGALAGAHIVRSEIFLPLFSDLNNSGDLCQIALHGAPDRPGSLPGFFSHTTLEPQSGWVGLPDWWGNYLRDHTDAGIGVTVPSSGFFKWRQVGADPLSGAIRFAGTR